jgi:3-deoxy-D-manno-octulosonate 8-phosphate phosphatase (KDO 8-P phosphatase)
MNSNKVEFFLLDVDGVMTDGKSYYTKNGKLLKSFGPDDYDSLCFLKRYINIQFITSDRKSGYEINKKRIVKDMGFKLTYVKSDRRFNWVKKNFDLKKLIFMGDGLVDREILKNSFYSIAPANADIVCKKYANYVTKNSGGSRAVSEACLHVSKKFFNKEFNIL